MKKVDAFIYGIASVSCFSNSTFTDVVEKFPSSYEKDVVKSLRDSWITVGKSLKGAVESYESEAKQSNQK